MRKVLAAGLITALMALAGLTYRVETVRIVFLTDGLPYAPAFRGDTIGPGAMLNAHDGQAFGSLALDPLLSHPDEWGGGRSQMAYRATRPLLGWLVGLTSLGSRWLTRWSLLAWTAFGAGVMAAGAFVLAAHWGRRTDWVPLLLLLPGMLGQLLFGGLSDGLAAGLALFGMTWWFQRRDRLALTALCLAALTRETTLLVPLALLLPALRSERQRARALVLPFLAYAAWVAVVWLRLHAVPTDPDHGRLSAPLSGLLAAVPGWSWVGWVSAVSIALLAVVAFRRAPSPEVRWLVVLSIVFASTMGDLVWRSWDFTRPLLPVTVVGACLLAKTVVPDADATGAGAASGGPAEPVPVEA
jgi:hypothetical protein